jgi:hypothetical protein
MQKKMIFYRLKKLSYQHKSILVAHKWVKTPNLDQ